MCDSKLTMECAYFDLLHINSSVLKMKTFFNNPRSERASCKEWNTTFENETTVKKPLEDNKDFPVSNMVPKYSKILTNNEGTRVHTRARCFKGNEVTLGYVIIWAGFK